MSELIFVPKNVCSRRFVITHEDGLIVSVTIDGGCQGNTTGLAALLKGMEIDEVIKRFDSITCRGSYTGKTSCPDQIAKALKTI